MDALRLFLESDGHQVYVFAPRFPGYRDDPPFVRRLPSITFPAKVRFPISIPIVPGLTRRAAALDIDLIHSHHPFGMGVIALRLARRLGRPLVTTIHTQYEQYLHYIPFPTQMVRRYVRGSVRRYCDSCQAVTTPAAGMAEVVRGYGVRSEVNVVPNGIDLRRYREASGEEVRRRFGLGDEHVMALFTGRVAPEKNLPALLEATRLALQSSPGFRLMVLGDGPSLPSLRRDAAALGIADRVFFPGAVPHEAVPPYCAAADLFVTASTTEVNPTSVIEAMAAGAPIAAYDTFGAREIVREGADGRLTEHTPEALSAAIASLAGDREKLAAMAAQAAESAGRFSLESTGRRMLAVYEQALRGNRGARRESA